MTQYIYRYYILVRGDKISVANQMAVAWGNAAREDLTFGTILLSANGNEPATYTCCNTAATEEMSTGIKAGMSNPPFYELYQLLSDGTIQQRVSNAWVTIATSGDFETVVLSNAGLQKIEGEL